MKGMASAEQVKRAVIVLILVLIALSRIKIPVNGQEDVLTLLMEKFGLSGIFSQVGSFFGMKEGSCPFINPYLTRLFSLGVEEEAVIVENPSDPLYTVLREKLGVEGGEVHVSFDGKSYRLWNGEKSIVLSREELENTFYSRWGLKLAHGIPAWQCFLVFALIPFITLFFLIEDILQFTLFSPTTKHLISLLVSIIAVYTGAFAQFIWQLAFITAFTVQGTFLIIIVLFSMLSLVFSWLGSFYQAMGRAEEEAAEVVGGLVQTALGEAILRSQRKLEKK